MPVSHNKGFDSKILVDYKNKINLTGRSYLAEEPGENSEECVHFYFIGKYENKEVICDAVMYTLRLHHESELFEVAEREAANRFPQYRKIANNQDDNSDMKPLDGVEEEIGLYMAEIIAELQEGEEVKVKEHVEIDDQLDFGIGLNIGLNIEKITSKIIEKFIVDFNEGVLSLDDSLFSFETHQEDSD
jgi:hypothetical protein